MNGHNELSLIPHIKRSVRRSGHGLRAWLGEPFRIRADEGPQNQGRQCDFIDVSRSFVPTANPKGKGEEVLLSNCSVVAEGINGRPELLPDTGDTGYLVLLTITTRALSTEPDQTLEFEQSPHQLAEGYAIDYGRVSNTRRPVRFVNSRVEERLFKLLPGESYRFYTIEPEARVLGVRLHSGRRVTYELKATETGISFNKVALTPLCVRRFNFNALTLDLGVAALLLVLGTILGAFFAPAAAVKATAALIGFGIGLSVFALCCVARVLFAMYTKPVYYQSGV